MSLDLRAKVCLWPVSASVHNITPLSEALLEGLSEIVLAADATSEYVRGRTFSLEAGISPSRAENE